MNSKDEYNLLTLIHKVDLFRELEVDEGKLILGLCERRSLEAGEVVWQTGDESTRCWCC
jgi:hypothetical protein